MKRNLKLADVLADSARRSAAVAPRLVRREAAAAYLSAPQLFALLEEAGWITPTVTRHRMVLFDMEDVDACIARLKAGDFPQCA